MKGPYGGYIQCIVGTGDTLFAGTLGRGAYRSTNRGKSWKRSNNGLSSQTVNVLVIASGTVYAGTNEGVFKRGISDSVWVPSNKGIANRVINSVAIQDSVVFAGSFGVGVFRSIDRGDNWALSNSYLTDYRVLSIAASKERVYVGTLQGIYCSTNQGVSWSSMSSGIDISGVFALLVRDSTLFAAGSSGFVYRSTGSGQLERLGQTQSSTEVRSLSFLNSTLIAGTNGSGVFVSIDSGSTWEASSHGLPSLEIRTVASIGEDVFAGMAGAGIFLSNDNGLNWQLMNDGLDGVGVTSMIAKGDSVFVGTNSAGVHVSAPGPRTLRPINVGLPNLNVKTFARTADRVFVGTVGGISALSDGDSGWQKADYGLSNKNVRAMLAVGSKVLAGTYCLSGGIHSTRNSGASWESSNVGLTSTCVLSLGEMAGSVGAGTENGVFRSTDGGSSWISSNIGLPSNAYVVAICSFNGIAFAGTEFSGVYKSSGSGWSPANEGLRELWTTSFAAKSNTIFVGTRSGVFWSTDDGGTWNDGSIGLPDSSITCLLTSGDSLFVGAASGGVYCRSIAGIVSGISGDPVARSCQLEQNYPNPFNPSTTIRYTLTQRTTVRLAVFDVLGREIATLVNGEEDAGSHLARFEGSNVASGVYLFRMQAGSITQTRCSLLLK